MKKIEYFIILVAIILVALFFPMPQGTPPQEIIDQYCTPKGYHWSLYPEINPYYQEIEVGMSGYLTRIQICSEAAEPRWIQRMWARGKRNRYGLPNLDDTNKTKHTTNHNINNKTTTVGS